MMDLDNKYWWKSDKGSEGRIYEKVFNVIRFIAANQNYRELDNLRHLRLYGNLNILGVSAWQYSRAGADFSRTNRVTYNIIKSMCDTLQAKICKNKPRPLFLTLGGDFALKQKAKKLTKFISGVFDEMDLYEIGQQVFLDSMVFDIGVCKFYTEDSRIRCERVFPDELKVDDVESTYGAPKTMYQTKYVIRDVLIEMFPEFKDQIERAQVNKVKYSSSTASDCDMVQVNEAWHLAIGPDAKDGRHVICIDNVDLLDEDWTSKTFPFCFMRWSNRLRGFYGQGLAEQTIGIQIEINKLLRTIQTAMHLCSVPRYWIENGSKVVKAHLNNEIGNVGTYTGTPPRLDASNAVPPELFSHLDTLTQRAFQMAGISELSAQSKKPAGLDSGVALREYNDIETERFVMTGMQYEKFYIDAATLCIEKAKELAKQDSGFKVLAKDKRHIEEINWADVNIDENKYLMQIFPTSMLPHTPAGKLQQVQEMLQAGFIGRDDGIRLLDFPDLESALSDITASAEDIEMTIEKILDKGEYYAPESYQDLELGIKKFQSAYLRAKIDGVPEEKLELMRRWMEEADTAIDSLQQPEMPMAGSQPPGLGEPPLGRPQLPPVTDLAPFTAPQGQMPPGQMPPMQ